MTDVNTVRYRPRVIRAKQALTRDEELARAEREMVGRTRQVVRPFETRYTRHHAEAIEQSGSYGPIVKSESVPWAGSPNFRSWYRTSTSYRSKTKRRKAPNDYLMRTGYYKLRWYTGPGQMYRDAPSGAEAAVVSNSQPIDAFASNKALSRFVVEVRDGCSASAAVTLAEWRQSQDMIVKRAGQLAHLLRAARSLRRGQLTAAFGVPVNNRSLKRQSSSAGANLWLEYHFGWVPLISDIYSAIQVLSAAPPPVKVRARGRSHETRTVGTWTPPPLNGDYITGPYQCKVEIGADVYVDNPNLALANQLGFVNPATVAWELIPFSFLVDWFIPVGQFLDSFTDLLGYRIEYPYTTTTRKWITDHRTSDRQVPSLAQQTFYDGSFFSIYRTRSIPAYRLRTVPFQGFSAARGATAIALVLQQLLPLTGKRG